MPHKIARSRRTGEYVALDHPDAAVETISGQKRKVVMLSTAVDPNGQSLLLQYEDFVPVEHLDEYVASARTRHQSVTVPEPDTHDSGPGGDNQHFVED